jgi:hypothetical protein
MKKFLLLLIFAAAAIAPARAQIITAQQVNTQQLTLSAQNPVPPPTNVQISSSVAGSSTYYYWIVTHSGSEVSAPAGPFIAANAPATLGGIYSNSIVWTPAISGATYDLLRTTTSVTPTGACGCAVSSGITSSSFTDGLTSTTAYTVATSTDQVAVICTNVAGCGSGNNPTFPQTAPNEGLIYVVPSATSSVPVGTCRTDPGVGTVCSSPWNTRQVNDCGVTTSSTTVTCPSGSFTSTAVDAGKEIAVFNNCVVSFTGLYAVAFTGTIASVTDSAHAVLSGTPTSNVTAAASSCIAYGNPDDAALSAADAVAAADPVCPVIMLPQGIGLAVQPHFYTAIPSCNVIPGLSPPNGQLEFWGFQVRGQGAWQSQLWIPPNFNWAACTNGPQSHACFGGGGQTYFRDWGLQGFGYDGASISQTAYLVQPATVNTYGKLENFNCNIIAPLAPNVTGLYEANNSYQIALRNTDFDGCGYVGLYDGGKVLAGNTSIEDSYNYQVEINTGALFQTDGFDFFISTNGDSTSGAPMYNYGGTAILLNAEVDQAQSLSGVYAYRGLSSSSLISVGSTFHNNNGANQTAIFLQDTASASLFDSTAYGYIDMNGYPNTSLTDQGGNSMTPGFYGTPGHVYGSASITGATLATGGVALTSGWGSGTTVSSASGDSHSFQFTITLAGTTTTPVATLTFPTAYWVAPTNCIAQTPAGTDPLAGTVKVGTPSATSVTFSYTGTFTAGDTIVQGAVCQ